MAPHYAAVGSGHDSAVFGGLCVGAVVHVESVVPTGGAAAKHPSENSYAGGYGGGVLGKMPPRPPQRVFDPAMVVAALVRIAKVGLPSVSVLSAEPSLLNEHKYLVVSEVRCRADRAEQVAERICNCPDKVCAGATHDAWVQTSPRRQDPTSGVQREQVAAAAASYETLRARVAVLGVEEIDARRLQRELAERCMLGASAVDVLEVSPGTGFGNTSKVEARVALDTPHRGATALLLQACEAGPLCGGSLMKVRRVLRRACALCFVLCVGVGVCVCADRVLILKVTGVHDGHAQVVCEAPPVSSFLA